MTPPPRGNLIPQLALSVTLDLSGPGQRPIDLHPLTAYWSKE